MGALTTEIKVGLFMLAGFLAVVYGSVLVTGWQPGQDTTYPLSAEFVNVSGLLVGAPVQVAGVKVGQVARIELAGAKARVHLEIYTKHKMHTDTTATIKSLGILGDKYISLHPGSPTLPALPQGSPIGRIGEGADLDSLIENLGGVLNDLRAVSSSLRLALGGEKGRQRLEAIMDSLAGASQGIEQITDTVNAEIEVITHNLARFSTDLANITAENRDNLHSAIADFASFAADLKGLAAENRQALTSALHNLDTFSAALAKDGPLITADLREILAQNKQRMHNLIRNLDTSTAKLDDTMVNLRSVSAKIDQGEGTLGRLVNDEKTIDELNSALTGINRFLTDANRLKLDIGGSTEYLARQGEFKSYFDIRLQPLKDRYYLLQLVDSPKGSVESKTTTTVESGGTSTKEETIVEDKFVASLLIAQRYYDTEIRGGLIEAEFGAAIHQFFGRKDQYRIGFDIWDFGRDEGAHVKAAAYWRFFSNAFLVVGGDDFTNSDEDLRDAFFGIGLHFNEDSLKPLFGSVAGQLTGQ